MIFKQMQQHNYERIIFCQDKESGLKAIIALHNTVLGPTLGGVRMWNYASDEEALQDVLRLSRGMTYKNALAGLDLGGGKAVIIGDPRQDKSEALFQAFGRYVEKLGGQYITAVDVGTTVADMDIVRKETKFVTGCSASDSSDDPSPITAYGVYMGIKAAAESIWQTPQLAGRKVAVQGVGHVGYSLCKYLHEEGAELVLTDIDVDTAKAVAREFDATVVSPEEIYTTPCDIFAPCALGGIVNDQTVGLFNCKVIAGATNNQLQDERHGEELLARGITYVPDYVINAGGAINVADELHGYNRERVLKKVAGIYDTVLRVLTTARENNISPSAAADQMAEERLALMVNK